MNDFGGRLRQARERRGISLRQIAASTKISVAALEALERNDVSKLPGGIFSRAFVRSYATEICLDPDATVKEFLQRFEAPPPEADVPPRRASEEATPAGRGHPRAAPADAPMRVEFQATAPCWVSAVVDGRKAVARIMRPVEHGVVMFEKEEVV